MSGETAAPDAQSPAAGTRRAPAPSAERKAEMDVDRALMRAHVAGDPQAFTELVRRHRDRMWAVALRTLGDRQEAEDALQEALISAFRNAHSYRGEAAVTTWLHRVVVNACLDRVRRRQARPSVPLGDREVASRRDEHAATETRLVVHEALSRLPEGQRAAIVLIDMEEISVAEAAVLLGVAEGTVKSRCSRGRAALALMLRQVRDATQGVVEATDAGSGATAGNRGAPARVASASPAAIPGPVGRPGAPPPPESGAATIKGGGAA